MECSGVMDFTHFHCQKHRSTVCMVTVDMFNSMECRYFYDIHASSICFVKQNRLQELIFIHEL